MDLGPDVFSVLFDANPRPMFVADRETLRILIVNTRACELYGWTRDELVTMTLRDIRPPEELAAFEGAFAAVKGQGAPYSRAARHWTKDGRIIDVTLELSPFVLRGGEGSSEPARTASRDVPHRVPARTSRDRSGCGATASTRVHASGPQTFTSGRAARRA